MGSAINNLRQTLEALLALVSTAAMLYFGNGLNPLWPLMWIACVPVLVFSLRSSWWMAALTAACAMLLGNLNLWSYL
jgi:apolipoprotein N-acyltransferase